ncbi:MAG TPA: hypothetical protein VGV35_06840 [Bryobacteraceae bacterium]|nr:hypothetical protein [Bryobacteraceae bacterium]
MNRFALALLLGSVPLFCADEALPRAETIVEHYIEVTGGRAAFEKHRTELMHGTFELAAQGVKGTMTVSQTAPDKNRVIIDLEGIGKIESGSDGVIAWENSALQGPRLKDGVEKADAFRDGTFNAPLHWQKMYTKMETTGIEKVGDHDCYKVVLTPPQGKPITHYFDKKSGLMVKTTTTRSTQMGDLTAEISAEDYRKEGDVLAPHKMINKIGPQEIQITVLSVEFNVDMPKDRFDPPEEIQALLKKAAQPAAKAAPASSATTASNGGKLNLFMNGKPFATETYTLAQSDGKIEISGSGNAVMGTIKVDIEQFKVVTDDKFHPIEAAAKAKLGTLPMNVKTTFAGGKATNNIDNGQGPKTKEDAVSADALVVNQNLPLYPWTLLAMRADLTTKDPQTFPVYVLGQSEVPATLMFKGREPVEFSGKTVDLNHLWISGKLQGAAVTLDLWVDDNRKIIKLVAPVQAVEGYQEGFERKAPAEVPKPEAAKDKG